MSKRRSKSSGAGTAALVVLNEAGVNHTVHTFESGHDHFGAQAAAELCGPLGIDERQLFKTLVVDLTAGSGPKRRLGVVCVPVTGHVNLKAAARAFDVPKVCMAEPRDAERSSGYVTGGISPVGQKNALPTVIDSSALEFGEILVSGGRRGLDVQLTPDDLAAVTGARFAAVAAPGAH
ncbi:aminoacyl-tRNA deacylase [Corynebacterium meridianum]|uniref:Cys-tRNA(Pro)/Cys-tRNA(Cys) deacylase n=1 Tax=Corynebacterium meridianum TaxID=2765363 RepID=A0A934HZ45_9CORY|nr:aminoacyl-tRNA deacylase [Corynebacterium meridianum]MBI8989608.1 aminoacyl-tRNA deacylase [Corynebacterium meridianum]MCK7677315.1 aminoacyl-tRNA deacylase [Corynebacterium meridianum]